MKVNIVTSGFPHGFTDDFITEVDRYLSSRKLFVFIASDFRIHSKTKLYHDRFLRMFREKGIVFDQSCIIDCEIQPEQAAECIHRADVVWLAGGPTLKQIAHLREYGLIEALQRRDGMTIGMSAGSINMARRVVYARDVREDVYETAVYEGIGLVDFNIEPHLNEAGPDHLEDIRQAAQIAPIHGLHDDAFILELGGTMRIYGKYKLFDERRDGGPNISLI